MALSPGDPAAWGVPADQALRPAYRQGAAYLDLKRQVEDDLIGRLERLFPGSTAEILHRESATPVTHTRFTRASAGSGYGLAATPDQFLQHRPGYRGPLPGLYLCGGSTRSGHGISGALASGVHAARTILKD